MHDAEGRVDLPRSVLDGPGRDAEGGLPSAAGGFGIHRAGPARAGGGWRTRGGSREEVREAERGDLRFAISLASDLILEALGSYMRVEFDSHLVLIPSPAFPNPTPNPLGLRVQLLLPCRYLLQS